MSINGYWDSTDVFKMERLYWQLRCNSDQWFQSQIEKYLNDKVKSDSIILQRKSELICHIIEETMKCVP